jgi:hypothetical protein
MAASLHTMHTQGQTQSNGDLATRIAALEDRAAIKQLVDRNVRDG